LPRWWLRNSNAAICAAAQVAAPALEHWKFGWRERPSLGQRAGVAKRRRGSFLSNHHASPAMPEIAAHNTSGRFDMARCSARRRDFLWKHAESRSLASSPQREQLGGKSGGASV
jgi:hypothetical protein